MFGISLDFNEDKLNLLMNKAGEFKVIEFISFYIQSVYYFRKMQTAPLTDWAMDAIVLSLATNSAYVLEIILVKCMGYYFSICALKCLVNALRLKFLCEKTYTV